MSALILIIGLGVGLVRESLTRAFATLALILTARGGSWHSYMRLTSLVHIGA